MVDVTRSGLINAYATDAPACAPASSPRFHHDNANSGDYRPGEMTLAKIMAGIGNFYETSTYVVPTAGSVIAQAVIQAAGSVTVNATQKIDNSVIRPNATDIKDAEVVSAAFTRALKATRPCGTLVQVAALAGDKFKVEIEADAIIGSGQ